MHPRRTTCCTSLPVRSAAHTEKGTSGWISSKSMCTSCKECRISRLIHENAHKQLEYLDEFGDVLHQRHLMQFYPTVEELALEDEVSDVDGVFNLLIRTFDHIQEALMSFRNAANQANLLPLALKTEELMMKNSNDYTVFLELWARWDTDGGSKTSFDGLCEEYLEGKED